MIKITLPSFLILFFLFTNLLFCQVTSIPDPNFEQALINDGIDSDGIINGVVLTSDIESRSSLNVRNENISDLTGIEDFTDLIYLNVGQNNLSTINLANNLNLEGLLCYNNNLTSLNLENNLNLTVINCSENQLTSLDVSLNLQLTELFCALNYLTVLDVSSNNLLDKFWCFDNDLTTLNVKNNANLLLAGTYSDPNTTYSRFRAHLNPELTCLFVDNANDANNFVNNYEDWQVDNTITFVENDAECNLLSQLEFNNNVFNVYPNPFKTELQITSKNKITDFKLFNTLGKLISEDDKIIFSDLDSGIYFLILQDETGNTSTKKIVKK